MAYNDVCLQMDTLGSAVPLLVDKGLVPIGGNAGTVAYPLMVLGPNDDDQLTGSYLSVQVGIPADIPGYFEFGESFIILRRMGEYPRSLTELSAGLAELVTAQYGVDPDPTVVARDEYLPQFSVLSQVSVENTVWYFTVFYKNNLTNRYTFSPEHGHARDWGYPNPDESFHGELLFSYLARKHQSLDAENADTAYRICKAIGRLFDSIKAEIGFEYTTRYDPYHVDAARLPYLDWLLGWPTNFDLPCNVRRSETAHAAEILQRKGAVNALRYTLRIITGWDVEIYEGWRWVLNTIEDDELDPLIPPTGWDATVDGDWAAIVGQYLQLQVTYDSTNPDMEVGAGTYDDVVCYTPSTDSWQNDDVVLIVLKQIWGVSGILPDAVVTKVERMVDFLLPHFMRAEVITETSLAPLSGGFGVKHYGTDPFGL